MVIVMKDKLPSTIIGIIAPKGTEARNAVRQYRESFGNASTVDAGSENVVVASESIVSNIEARRAARERVRFVLTEPISPKPEGPGAA